MNVHPGRLEGAVRQLLDSGDINPTGARIIRKIIADSDTSLLSPEKRDAIANAEIEEAINLAAKRRADERWQDEPGYAEGWMRAISEANYSEWGVILDDGGSTDIYPTRHEADAARKGYPDTGLVRILGYVIEPAVVAEDDR